eukprot:scaffold32249_cov96-Isochrysis_galbana.AAC.1
MPCGRATRQGVAANCHACGRPVAVLMRLRHGKRVVCLHLESGRRHGRHQHQRNRERPPPPPTAVHRERSDACPATIERQLYFWGNT